MTYAQHVIAASGFFRDLSAHKRSAARALGLALGRCQKLEIRGLPNLTVFLYRALNSHDAQLTSVPFPTPPHHPKELMDNTVLRSPFRFVFTTLFPLAKYTSAATKGLATHLISTQVPRRFKLPREVIIVILRIIASEALSEAQAVFNDLPTSANYIAKRRLHARATLCSAIFVSRAWRAVGTEFLYSEPVLMTPYHTRLFIRTLERSPDLERFVKEVWILDTRIAFTPRSFTALRHSQKYLSVKKMKADVEYLLEHCSELQALSVGLEFDFTQAEEYHFFRAPLITTDLRKLTVHQCTFYSVTALFAFPFLEVLCLHRLSLTLNGHFDFPPLYRLHTLQLVRPEGWFNHPYDLDSLQKVFPALCTVEVFGNYQAIADAKVLACLPFVQQICCVGIFSVQELASLIDCPALAKIRHLTIGVVGPSSRYLASWRISPALESLTLFVNLMPSPDGGMDGALHLIRRCLNNNKDRIDAGTLRRLVINTVNTYRPNFVEMEDVTLSTFEIQVYCALHGMEIEVHEYVGK